jgi:peptidoglycan/LPS O-acetylase OafA/YrhL
MAVPQGASERATSSPRLPFLDLLRAVASQLIVLHHLAFYGPLSERAYSAAPVVFDWLVDYARMAVQVFFVVGGFLAGGSFGRAKHMDATRVRTSVVARYRRIGFPYLVALGVAILANELASQCMTHPAISARPTFGQLLAHSLFLHDVLGYPALTAGIWYLAIDFQLYLMTLLLFAGIEGWVSRRGAVGNLTSWQLSLLALLPVAVLSLLWFNRRADLDCWAIYFVGSYYLGLLLREATLKQVPLHWAATYFGLTVVAGLLDSRPRLLVAAGTALLVFLADRWNLLQRWPDHRFVNYLGRISYSLFLIHFPVLLVINAWGVQRLTTSVASAIGGLLIAYVASLLAAILLYHTVEKRIR